MQSQPSIASVYDQVSPRYDTADDQTRVAPEQTPDQRLYWLVYDELTWRATKACLLSSAPLRVLDAGGGAGKYGVRMARLGHHVTVLDLSEGMLTKARAAFAAAGLTGQATFEVGSIVDLPFAAGAFDFVLCEGDPVSYTQDQHPRALAELLRVLVPGGKLILGVDNRYAHFLSRLAHRPAEAHRLLLTGQSRCPYGLPVLAFTLPQLLGAARAAGGEVVDVQGKPALFYDQLEALRAERGEAFDAWESREEIIGLQEGLSRQFPELGGHFQVTLQKPGEARQ